MKKVFVLSRGDGGTDECGCIGVYCKEEDAREKMIKSISEDIWQDDRGGMEILDQKDDYPDDTLGQWEYVRKMVESGDYLGYNIYIYDHSALLDFTDGKLTYKITEHNIE